MPAPPLIDVITEHLEEMASLWTQRRRLILSSDAPIRALGRVEARIGAHRDGLVVGNGAAVTVATEHLATDDPWLCACAVLVWLEQGTPTPQQLIERLASADPALQPSWREALRRLERGVLDALLPADRFARIPHIAQEALVDAWGWTGILDASTLDLATRSEHAGVRRAAARFARESSTLRRLMDDSDLSVSRRALWSSCLVEPVRALARARDGAYRSPADPVAVRVLGLFGDAEDGERLAQLVGRDASGLAAIAALLDLAVPQFAGSLVPLLQSDDEATAALAREAFESLVGPVPAVLDADQPEAPGEIEWKHWNIVRDRIESQSRFLRGKPHPWPGAPEDRPMESLWRNALASGAAETAWLSREVPDGLFDGPPSIEALPGV